MRIPTTLILALLIAASIPSCTKSSAETPAPTDTTAVFAKGADISWATEMEQKGIKFYSGNGTEMECTELMKNLGMNAIRLRVWVNPANGWCNKEDMLAKAQQASNLGMRLMIDFHYSDSWADPGKQNKPARWQNLTVAQLKDSVSNHTKEALNMLKVNNIKVEWVQVGNETGNGMLWDDGKADISMANYAALNNAGYDAVKAVYPKAKVIVHLQEGANNALFRWLFDGLKANGGKWDVIGMSLYPSPENWKTMNGQCISNINDMVSRYGSEVMICEVGMSWSNASASKAFLDDIIARAKGIKGKKCLGVFYWEPEAHNNWEGYQLGAFNNNGSPTSALDAFKN